MLSSMTNRSWIIHVPKSTPTRSLFSNPDSTSTSNPSTQALFGSSPAFTPKPSALFHFAMWMLLIKHPASSLHTSCSSFAAPLGLATCTLAGHTSIDHIYSDYLEPTQYSIGISVPKPDCSEHCTHLAFGPRWPSHWLHLCFA